MDFMEGVSETNVTRKRIVILTDDSIKAMTLQRIFAAGGDQVDNIDALFFTDGDLVYCDQVVFNNCSNRDTIMKWFRSDYYKNTYGGKIVEFLDVDGAGKPIGQSAPAPAKLKASDTLAGADFALPSDPAPKAGK